MNMTTRNLSVLLFPETAMKMLTSAYSPIQHHGRTYPGIINKRNQALLSIQGEIVTSAPRTASMAVLTTL